MEIGVKVWLAFPQQKGRLLDFWKVGEFLLNFLDCGKVLRQNYCWLWGNLALSLRGALVKGFQPFWAQLEKGGNFSEKGIWGSLRPRKVP